MKSLKHIIGYLLVALVLSSFVAVGAGWWFYRTEIKPFLPDVSSIKSIELSVPLRIYSRDNLLISEVGETRRYLLTSDNIPEQLKQALLSIEDRRFYQHVGIDLRSLLRAFIELVKTGRKSQGASTITMQLARNYYLTRTKSYTRKIVEIILAWRIEQLLTKEEILTLYMNKVFLGYRSYGFESAASTYYGKTLSDLSLAELAMLAGLPKAPSTYNPIVNPKRARQRRNYILEAMLTTGKIDKNSYEEAIATPVHAKIHGANIEISAGHAAEMARRQAVKILGEDAFTAGYKVFTTIDAALQSAAVKAVQKEILSYNLRQPYPGAARYFALPHGESWNLNHLSAAINKTKDIDGLTRAVVTHSDNQGVSLSLRSDDSWEEVTISAKQLKWVLSFDGKQRIATEPLYSDQAPIAIEESARFTTELVVVGQESTDLIVAFDDSPGDFVRMSTLVDVFEVVQRPLNRKPMPVSVPNVLPPGAVVYVVRQNRQWRLNSAPLAQAALVSIDPDDGAIVALVGGFNFRNYKFNRAVQANRQPGSNFKPFIYAAALAKGHTAADVINDAPVTFENAVTGRLWQPSNYSGKYFGPTRLRDGLIYSRNLVSVRLMHQIGVDYTIDFLSRFGFSRKQFDGQRNLSIALGSVPMSPLAVARAYAVFANQGYLIQPYLIQRIEDLEGNIVYASTAAISTDVKKDSARVLDESLAYIMNDLLKDVIRSGTARAARRLKRRDLAGKTGTTNQQFDAWFTGFNSDFVTAIWVGRDKPRSLGKKETGARAALPIWINYMQRALQYSEETFQAKPENIVTLRIYRSTGRIAQKYSSSKDVIFELFRSENIPEHDTSGETHDPALQEEDLRSKLF